MDNLSTAASIDISSQIGALELSDDMENHNDGALEAAGANMMANGPTQIIVATVCRGIDDGTLEAAGANMVGPTLGNFGCGAVPQTNYCVQYRTNTDDAALEAAAGPTRMTQNISVRRYLAVPTNPASGA